MIKKTPHPLQSQLTKPFYFYLAMIILGIISGFSHVPVLAQAGLIISSIFINIFKCISIPIISLSIIVTLATYQEGEFSSLIWKKTLLYTLSTTIIAATVSFLLYHLIKPTLVHQMVQTADTLPINSQGYLHYLSKIIPDNLLVPFIEHQVISILFISIIVGIAIRYIPDETAKQTTKSFFRGIHSIFFVITKWIIAILPVGIFGFITQAVLQLQDNQLQLIGIGEYLLVIILANVVQGLVILPLWLKLNGISPYRTLRKMLPALSLAFFSKSSAGTLPVTISTSEKNLGLHPQIARFVLPLCTSINMNGCAAFIFVTVVYLMQNQGMDVSNVAMLGWILIATVAALGNAGVPMGCFFLSASLLSSMDVSIVLLGVILPFYNVIDMIETALNVWSDSCVATVVNQQHKMEQETTTLAVT